MQAILVTQGFCADFLGKSSGFQVKDHSLCSESCQLHPGNKLNKHKHEVSASVTGCLTLSHLHSDDLTAEQRLAIQSDHLYCMPFFCAPKLSSNYNVYLMNAERSFRLVKLQKEILFLVWRIEKFFPFVSPTESSFARYHIQHLYSHVIKHQAIKIMLTGCWKDEVSKSRNCVAKVLNPVLEVTADGKKRGQNKKKNQRMNVRWRTNAEMVRVPFAVPGLPQEERQLGGIRCFTSTLCSMRFP